MRYYNKSVKQIGFYDGELILRKVMPNIELKNSGALGPNWEGPYKIRELICPATYRLEILDGKTIKHTWNAQNLKKFYI